jgi:hypothetical protein
MADEHLPAPWCPRNREREVVEIDRGGWISGGCSDPEPEPAAPILPLTGAALQAAYGDRWVIDWNPLGVWTAERTEGNTVHYLVDKRAWVLAKKIEQAERDD